MHWTKKYKSYDTPKKRESFFRCHVIDMSQSSLLFSNGLNPFVMQEIENCFVNGNFVACILLCQLTIEHCLANLFILTEHESICTKGFSRLIKVARKEGLIDDAMEAKLTKLRLMRNPYVHPRFGCGEGTFIKRVLDEGCDYNELPVADGIEAIKILGEFLNKN